MTRKEIEEELWGACLLGARVVADQNDTTVTGSRRDSLVGALRQIAESDFTLEDPTALTATAPRGSRLLMRLATLTIRSDRDLATRILQGYRTCIGEDE